MSGELGLWMIGARGGIATCIAVGLAAMRKNLAPPDGLVTELEDFRGLDLAPLGGIVLGGHEIRNKTTLLEEARITAERAGSMDNGMIDRLADDLRVADAHIRPGTATGCGRTIEGLADGELLEERMTLSEIVARIRTDVEDFKRANNLDRVVVVNIASTEPYRQEAPGCWRELPALEKAIAADDRGDVGAAMLYAYAAISAGYPYINFTPSVAGDAPALMELALRRGVPHMGKDGKTGETLVKTVLAPMFVARNLRIMSWEGYNIFGNRDAVVLDDPQSNLAKTVNKDATLRKIVGDPRMHSRVRIDYCPSLDDWKTAWDFIHFRGFLGTKMRLHFIWEGCDSMLAAPLAIDMARLADLAGRRGESGLMPHLASFFKNPIGVDEQGFSRQFDLLTEYARRAGEKAKLPGRDRMVLSVI